MLYSRDGLSLSSLLVGTTLSSAQGDSSRSAVYGILMKTAFSLLSVAKSSPYRSHGVSASSGKNRTIGRLSVVADSIVEVSAFDQEGCLAGSATGLTLG